VRIIDKTDYHDLWIDLDAEERREYTLADFEVEVIPEVEVEPFETLFYKSSPSHLHPLGYLKGHWSIVETLITCQDDEWVILDPESQPMRRLLSDRYLFERVVVADEDKLNYFKSFNLSVLRAACRSAGVKTGKSKQEVIDRMIESKQSFSLPPAVVPAPAFYEWLEGLVRFYVEDIRRNADRFHPLYHEEIWNSAREETDIPRVVNKIDAVIQSKYWLERLRS